MKNQKKEKKERKKQEFSKALLIQESILIWIVTLCFIGLAFVCVFKGYLGQFPWLVALTSLPWTAYGVSQAFYYNKAKKENTKGGIKYESVMATLTQEQDEFEDFDDDEGAVRK